MIPEKWVIGKRGVNQLAPELQHGLLQPLIFFLCPSTFSNIDLDLCPPLAAVLVGAAR